MKDYADLEEKTYQHLEVYYPQIRPADLVSTPLRMMVQFLKEGLEKKKKGIQFTAY